jgi:cephalosporin hydroxylase
VLHPRLIASQAIDTHDAIQKGGELTGFLALLMDLRPLEVIVEIGSDAGGTLWAWQQLGARVIGVDKPGAGFNSGLALNDHGCEIVYGDSHDPLTRQALLGLLKGRPVDVLFIDGDHSYNGVRADYEMYAPLVRAGGVIGLHDICDHPRVPQCKVKAFWDSLDVPGKEEIVTEPRTWMGIGVIRTAA